MDEAERTILQARLLSAVYRAEQRRSELTEEPMRTEYLKAIVERSLVILDRMESGLDAGVLADAGVSDALSAARAELQPLARYESQPEVGLA